jgi:hypothetical protein
MTTRTAKTQDDVHLITGNLELGKALPRASSLILHHTAGTCATVYRGSTPVTVGGGGDWARRAGKAATLP